ncbi:acyltransferase [Candidatus Thorarchaeota archaeon]|nr:MAG: acyltransferase [Candidatus Thorarchaeota archaeon]
MELKRMRIGLGQIEPQIGEMDKNLRNIRSILDQARENDVEILVLPELANSGYAFDSKSEAFESAERVDDGEFSHMLKDWSKNGRLIVSGLCERDDERIYNSAVVFAEGSHILTYRKVHLFNKEKLWFAPGTTEPPTFEHNDACFGVMVCWDWAFPEMARILALKGAQVILHPSNLVLPYCFDAMKIRSLENHLFTATCNRTGTERNLQFSGKSQFTSPKGEVLLSLGEGEPELGVLNINPSDADEKKLTPRNDVLADRKPEIYSRLTRSS